jgi:hypothetical protein
MMLRQCATHCFLLSCSPVPGFISRTIFSDSIQPGWNWLPYNARNSVLLARDQGVDSSVATCTTLSQGGAVKFQCRQCSRTGYQPFAGAEALRFDIRSNTQSNDEFASSTPRGELPGLKLFLMNVSGACYTGMKRAGYHLPGSLGRSGYGTCALAHFVHGLCHAVKL